MKCMDCRVCGSHELSLVYDFGPQPLAGEFPLKPQSIHQAQYFPLDLTQCDACSLLQVTNLPPINQIFHEEYRYSSSTVPALVSHFSEYATWLTERIPTGANILEFGCNDGILLSLLHDRGFSCLGIDASANMAKLSRAKGIETLTAFMNAALVHEYHLNETFDLITCSNVLAHINDIHSVLEGVKLALKPNGLFSIEVHDAETLIREIQFETIYHEHLTYYTKATLRRMIESAGFIFEECINTSMHGGSLRLLCRLNNNKNKTLSSPKPNEKINGSKFKTIIDRCTNDIRRAVNQHGLLDGYGAAGRAQMFINMTQTADCYTQIFDDSAFRQGRYIVGTDIPIRPFNKPISQACIILAWNYAPDIAKHIRDHYKQVITVLPEETFW